MLVLIVCFLLKSFVQSDTTSYISCSFSNVELFIACLCIHNHLTSIKFSSGVRVGRNTRCILLYDIWPRFLLPCCDLCIGILSLRTRNICLMLSPYFWSYSLFIKSRNCFPPVFFITMCPHLVIGIIIDTKHV